MIGIYYSSCYPLSALAPVIYPKQKEIKPESELRFGYGMSFQYHGQMLHGLNRYNLLVGLEIPDLRIPEYYTPGQDMYNSQFCEGNNKPETQVWYKTCNNVWPAVQTAIRKVHDLRYEIEQIYQEELPAIIPNYKVGPMKKSQELNTSPVVSRKKRFLTDIIGLGIQAFSAISQHRKQNKLEKSMKHLKHRQDALDHKIEALEDDMISTTKETFEELDYLRRELELTGYNIKVLTAEIKRVEYELSKHVERVMKNRESRLYANKIDYLMDTNDASNVFSGHNKYQTILFIGILIFVIILIVCLFGKFLGLNSHFQNILATINKITASIKTLLPAALPATVQAATITHGDVSLHIDYFEILLYVIEIITVMGVLYAILWFIVKIWNCVNTRNLGNLKEKLSFMKFLYIDKTELHFQFMSNHMTCSIYLGSVYDNPEGIVAEGQFLNGDIILYKGCV